MIGKKALDSKGKPLRLPTGKMFQKHLNKELSRPRVLDEIARVEAARNDRPIETTAPRVIEWTETEMDKQHEYGLRPLEGSVTIFWARKGSGMIAALERAYLAHDHPGLDALYRKLIRPVLGRSLVSVADAVSEALDADSFFDISYAGRPIVNSVFLPREMAAGSITLPYEGGKLDSARFNVREYSKDGKGRQYDVLALVAPPTLTAVERRALDAVPASMQDIHIGAPTRMAVLPTVVLVLIIVGLVTIASTCCGNVHDRLADLHLAPADLEGLDGVSSARRLLDLRRRLFEETGIR
jgi:hypothetical protein